MLVRIRRAAAAAREKGTLKSIPTTSEVLASNPPFLLRVLASQHEKSAAGTIGEAGHDVTASAPATRNPFLPYEASMFVQDVPPAHVLLLNKFNVVADHTLLVTREFQEQSSLLTAGDFSALWVLLRELGGLGFYNAGRVAGASQRHKHLQHVAAMDPGAPEGRVTPFDGVLGGGGDGVYTTEELGFVHGVVGMGDIGGLAEQGADVGAVCMQRYTELLRVVGEAGGVAVGGGVGDAERQPFAYNLVCTRQWMMVVPRRQECFQGVSVNALGFVGCLLVRDEEQMEVVRRVGGLEVLREVAYAVDSS